VARAKRTDRAEARRRYRAAIQAEAIEADEADDTGTSPSGAGARAAEASAPRNGRPAPPPSGRVGLVTAFRLSARPADVRADLAALPWIVRHTKAIWVPTLLIVASSALILLPGGIHNQWTALAYYAFVFPPPMASAFLAGILTPRGAWLAGGVVGLISAIVFAPMAPTLASAAQAPARTDPVWSIGYAFIASPVFGMAVGAFAGFYRRFLAISNPNRGRARQRSGGRRPGQRAVGSRATVRRR
jgi:hypothetical protein